MNYGFVIDNRKCIGCHACTVACKAEHRVPLGVNRTWVKYVEKGVFPHTRRTFTVHRCNHCADAPCVEICPTTAMFTRADGIVDFDTARCIGCKSCMQACPYDALYIDPDTHTAAKCNYCAHRVEDGLEPACVIVCPEEAIVSGDLDDPGSAISRLVAREEVTARKSEKGTRPKLFYIEGDEAALRPSAAPPALAYSAAAQAAGVGHHAADAAGPATWFGSGGPESSQDADGAAGPARRAYDAPAKGVLWGWEVSGYVWTKSIAAGMVVTPLLLEWAGMRVGADVAALVSWISLAFLGLTGLLLVRDLDRPWRFLYVLLRPQWRSWLVRGAYLIVLFGALTLAWGLIAAFRDSTGPPLFRLALAVTGIGVAAYTGFLFAQAKGRDGWQSPVLPLHMVVQSLIAGATGLLALIAAVSGRFGTGLEQVLAVLLGIGLALLFVELAVPHANRDAEAAVRLMARGPLRVAFWSSVALGQALPLVLLVAEPGPLLTLVACALVLGFALLLEHTRVRAPQLVPLS